MFEAQVEALGGDYRCVTWDERGPGEAAASAPFTYWDWADDALALLDHLGIEQATFAGMSQSGFLSCARSELTPKPQLPTRAASSTVQKRLRRVGRHLCRPGATG